MPARLRKKRFFSLAELNMAIWEVVAGLNARVMRKAGRQQDRVIGDLEGPALKGLPSAPYQCAEWMKYGVWPLHNECFLGGAYLVGRYRE